MPQPGDILAGRFRLDALIGRGGMASVFRAWDTVLDRPVAVKLLRSEIIADPDLALRFRREAHAAAVLHHPNVVGYLGAGSDGATPYLVMELVEGDDLATLLRAEAPLPATRAARIANDIANGLAIAHARGIVHRDVKPGNILIDGDGRARITDFGVARIAAEAESTIPGTTLGSVQYFSPEQAQGLTTTPASDVYSLGLVLYEMLTGTRPFGGQSTAAVALARVGAPPPAPRDVRPDVPAELDAIVRRALAQDPAARYRDGGALADALAQWRAASVPTDPASTTVHYVASVQPVGSRSPAAPAGHGGLGVPALSVATALVLIVVFVGALTLASPGADPRTGFADPTDSPAATTAPSDPPSSQPPPVIPSNPPATPAPTPAQTADLCEPDPGATCALAAGSYAPSRFQPEVSIDLGDGWATFRTGDRLVVLARDEGYLTLASGVTTVFDGDVAYDIRPNANALIDAFQANSAVSIVDRRRARVDDRRAVQFDLVTDGGRVPLFASGDDVFYAEPDMVTRVYVFQVRGEPVLLVLEGTNGVDLDGFADAAADALASLTVG